MPAVSFPATNAWSGARKRPRGAAVYGQLTATPPRKDHELPRRRRSGGHHRAGGRASEHGKPGGAPTSISRDETTGGVQVIEAWDSQEHIDRFMEAGFGTAVQAAQIPQPTITEFEVHTLDWIG